MPTDTNQHQATRPEHPVHPDANTPANQTTFTQESGPPSTKLVITTHGNTATIGIQKQDTDPYITAFNFSDLFLLLEEVPGVIQAASRQWDTQPLYPEYQQPEPPPTQNSNPTTPPRQQQPDQGTLTLF